MRRHACLARVFMSLSLATAVTLAARAGSACGYHDDVTMARGILNWAYPDALHVLGSISSAVADRRLPAPSPAGAPPDLFGARYRETVKALEQLAKALGAAGEARPLSFSLVLIEPMLWTRFEFGEKRMRLRVHATGPERDELVLVSGEVVIDEIASGRLTIGKAHRLGLMRLYGPAVRQAQFLLAYAWIGQRPLAAATPEHTQTGSRSQQGPAPLAAATAGADIRRQSNCWGERRTACPLDH